MDVVRSIAHRSNSPQKSVPGPRHLATADSRESLAESHRIDRRSAIALLEVELAVLRESGHDFLMSGGDVSRRRSGRVATFGLPLVALGSAAAQGSIKTPR